SRIPSTSTIGRRAWCSASRRASSKASPPGCLAGCRWWRRRSSPSRSATTTGPGACSRHVRSRIALGVLLVLVLAMAGVAHPQYPYDDPGDAAPQPGTYQQALAPYGYWQTEPSYGQFWQPSVPAGWRPYADGQWVWTAYGWTWTSYEPWSGTFHYGRWGYLPPRGWVWFPGTVWGPAWVTWVTYSDYVGWAPLSPFGQPVLNNFVFVRSYDFCAPQLRTLV